MLAWSTFSPRQGRRERAADEDFADERTATTNAKKTESILEMMQDLWDEERSARSTLLSLRAAWEERGEGGMREEVHAPPSSGGTIAPDTSSYNTVLKAWSRTSDSEAAPRALRVYQTMMSRGNVACLARESLTLGNSGPAARRKGHTAGVAFPDSRTFVILLQSLQNLPSTIGFEDALDAIECLVQSAKKYEKQMQWSIENGILPMARLNVRGKSKPILNEYSYNTIIKTLSNLPAEDSWEESHRCCVRIDALIREMKQSRPKDAFRCLPNVITAWAKCAERAGDDREQVRLCAERAGAHIDALLKESVQSNVGKNFLGHYLVQAINETIALYGRAGMPSRADDLFSQSKGLNTQDLGTLSTIISVLCDNGSEDIAHVEKARDYLLEFEREKMGTSRPFVIPDMKFTSMYNNVISGFINCDMKTRGLEQAQALLAHMVSSHESNLRHIARPNTTSFARVMSALAQRGDNTKLLEQLLRKLEFMHQRRKRTPKSSPEAQLVANVAPNVVIYNILLKSYARCKDDGALESALGLLRRMKKDPDNAPDDLSNSYIMALMNRKNGVDGNSTISLNKEKKLVGPDSTRLNIDIENLNLSELNLGGQTEGLTSKSFNSLMNVHTTTGTVDGAEKGAALLRKLENMYNSGEIDFRPDIILQNKVMNAWHLCEKNNRDQPISPAAKAQEILDALCKHREMGGEDEVTPNDVSFSICIHSWCKSNLPDAAERAEQLLRRKEVFAKKYDDVQIKSSDYNSVISKWKDDPVNGPERATLLFEELLLRYGDSEDGTKPTAATLNALLDVYAKCRDHDHLAEKGVAYLNRMNQLYKEGKGCILPDVISYRSAIDAWIRRWHKDSPQKVDALVKEMIAKYKDEGRRDLCPDSNALNLVLKACAHAPAMWKGKGITEKGNDHPIAIANRTFSLLKGKNEYGASATHATYSFMFHIYRQHMDFRDKRYATLMQNMWKHCCKDGLVSKFSLESFRDSVLEPDFWKALGGKDRFVKPGKTKATDVLVEDLPKEWSCHVLQLKDRGKR